VDRSDHDDFYLGAWPGVTVCCVVDTVKVIPSFGEDVKAMGYFEGDFQLVCLTDITKQGKVVAFDGAWVNQFLAKSFLENRVESGDNRCSVLRRCARRKARRRRILEGG